MVAQNSWRVGPPMTPAPARQRQTCPGNHTTEGDHKEWSLDAIFDEYIRVQSQHLDMPSVLTQLSSFQQARGR